MSVLDLVEWQYVPLGPDAEAIARLVIATHDSNFDIQEPSRLTGQDWAMRSRGLVGYLPLGDGHALRIAPKVSIRSLLAMLDLAPDLDSLDWHEGTTVEGTVEGLFDVLAMLLARKVANRVRKGLHRAYIEERDELQAARGRILPRETLARRLRGATGLVCDFETLTDDLIDNQILLWTLERLRRSSLGSPEVRREVRSSHRLLAASLSLVPVRPEDCVREYHQLNADYRPLHALCRLLLEACGSALTEGSAESIPFTIWMPTLFERYIARWLARELGDVLVDDHVAIKLADGLSYDADVVLRDRTTRAPLAVLDTKYKDSDKPEPGDVQQVVFYATALGCTEAMLVYPRPVTPVHVQAGPVHVRTLGVDLSKLPATDAAPFLSWAANLSRSAA